MLGRLSLKKTKISFSDLKQQKGVIGEHSSSYQPGQPMAEGR